VNPHWHGLIRLYPEDPEWRVRQARAILESGPVIWRKLVKSGTVDWSKYFPVPCLFTTDANCCSAIRRSYN